MLTFFFSETFFILLESSETHFDLVANKIGAKLNNLVIYDDFQQHHCKSSPGEDMQWWQYYFVAIKGSTDTIMEEDSSGEKIRRSKTVSLPDLTENNKEKFVKCTIYIVL